jgi:hypothetical protein
MWKWLKQQLSYANVMATLALFVGLGGTSYAVTQLPKNSVGSKQLRKGAVSARTIKSGAIRSRGVKDGVLLAKDFKPGQLPAGPTGPMGPPGSAGQKGEKGEPGPTFAPTMRSSEFTVNSGAYGGGTAMCAAGEAATGGAVHVSNALTGLVPIIANQPAGPLTEGVLSNGWTGMVRNQRLQVETVTVYVLCVRHSAG